jgi:mannobiose 2-epimerase
MPSPARPVLVFALASLALPAGAADAPPAAVPAARLAAYGASAEKELRGNILPFWLAHARDREHGGFHAYIGEDMKVHDDQPRGALLTSRVLWTFSAAYRLYKDPDYLEMARWAYRDLVDRFTDKTYGGLFWTAEADGQPADGHKQIYGQVFGIYGLSEYYRATGDTEALERAKAIYALVEANAHDAAHGGYFDSLTRAWRRPESGEENLLGDAPKSQNSHIHILEGFTNLLRVWPDEGLRRRERELIELTMDRIVDPRTHHLILFMKDDWTPIGDKVSYGHDIELSWLLTEAAEELGDPALLARARPVAVAIARVTNAEGVDADGGVYDEGGPKGITNPHKDWWPQAEAAIGFLNAYQITGDPGYFADSVRSWDFIQAKMVDRTDGDWYETLNRDGSPVLSFTWRGRAVATSKVSIWKCPYHNGRSCLQILERTRALQGTATAAAP